MKKLSIILLIIGIFFSHVSAKNINAQAYEDGVVDVSTQAPDLMMETISTESSKVQYELPYPGMLPDNPFYPLKMARDKIVKALISDPFKRAQFNLLTAEKRMFAGKLLVDKKKEELAIATIEKSSNYMDDTLRDIKQAKKEYAKNPDIKPFLEHFKTVTLKFSEIIGDLKGKINDNNVKRFEIQEKRIEDTKKTVEMLIKQY